MTAPPRSRRTGRHALRSVLSLAAIILVITPAPGLLQDTSGGVARIYSHQARMTILPEHRSIICTDTILLGTPGDPPESVSVRLHPAYSVEGVRMDGRPVGYTFRGGTLTVPVSGRDTLFRLAVTYSGIVDFPSVYSRISSSRAVLREEEVLPVGERDLRSGRLRITVPSSWSAVTAGEYGGVVDSGLTRTFTYSWNDPIPSIGWICAGEYEAAAANPSGTTVATYRFPGDSTGSAGLATLADSVLAYYGRMFSPYPYDRLSILEIDDWVAGRGFIAIAGPGFVMVKNAAFSTADPFNRVETVLPHEIAHQWWPMEVFVPEEDAAFLSEGLCEYSSLLYNEFSGRLGSRDTLGRHPLLGALLTRVRQGRGEPLSGRQDLRGNPTQYLKSAYVHHMLRGEMGTADYTTLIGLVIGRFRHRLMRQADFEDLVREVSGKDMTWFFDQWVRSPGLPALRIYNVKRERTADHWIVRGRFRLVGYEKYTVSALVAVYTDTDTMRVRLRIGADSAGRFRNDVPFEFTPAHTPLKVVVDPEGDLLKLRSIPEKLADLRDPADGVLIVGTLRDEDHLRSLARRDSAVLDQQGWTVSIRSDTDVTLGDLQRKAVLLYGLRGQNRRAAELAGSFPISPGEGEVVVGGETVRDSTLGILQVVENPYLSGGVLCWVAPLGPEASPELLPYDRSWILLRGKDEIASGTWEAPDRDLEVEFAPVR